MKTRRNIMIAVAGIILASCSQNSLVGEPEVQNDSFSFGATLSESKSTETGIEWKSGVKAGVFSIANNNEVFTNSVNGENGLFSGNLSNNIDNEYIYVTYPYSTSGRMDSERNYTYSIPTEQVQDTYVSDLSRYDYMIGSSQTKVSSDEDFSSVQFEKLMARMDFAVGNETGSDIQIHRITMTSNDGSEIFSTSAQITLDPSTSLNMNTYKVDEPSTSTLSVEIANPTNISSGRSEVISITFFPIDLMGGTELSFTVETNKGNYSIVKTIGGIGDLNFTRGRSYITPITLS